MKITIKKGIARGSIKAPPSKSVAHRLLICAALADGVSVIRGVSYSEDILATLDCIETLGAAYSRNGDSITVHGCGGRPKGGIFPCRESGSTLRFFIPVACVSGDSVSFTGTERLLSRGIGVYEDLLAPRGISFEKDPTSVAVRGRLEAGEYKISGAVSSQFISGMLFALAALDGESTVTVIPPFESRSYVMITVDVLRKFGAQIECVSDTVFRVKGGGYKPQDISVEGDWSNAAFLFALNSLGGDVEVSGLERCSLQGDRVCADYLRQLSVGYAELDLSDCPDLAPIMFAVAAAGHGARFTGTARLKIKESDRAAAMASELSKLGARVRVLENEVTVEGGGLRAPMEVICGHNDHRIVMAMAVLCTLTGGTIDGCEAVRKSYPDFFEVMSSLGLEINYEA